MMNRFRTTTALIACILVAAAAVPLTAADAREIFETAMGRYEERLASIESVTIVQEVMGMKSTARLEKVMIEDRPVLVPRGGAGRGGDLGSMYRHFDHMAKNATVTGTEEVDGHPCWVVNVTELGGTQMASEGAGD